MFRPWVLSVSSYHAESVLLTIVDHGTVELDDELLQLVRSYATVILKYF